MANETEGLRRSRLRIGPAALIAAICIMVAFSVAGLVNPLLYYAPERVAQAAMLNSSPGARTIFTTYFYWYRSGGSNYAVSPHVWDWWNSSALPPKVPSDPSKYPSGWPGPTNPLDMVKTYNGQYYHDSCTYHPPAEPPQYDATGAVIEGSLKNSTMENITTWFDWMNESWNQWEIRCIMRSGIDVLMPVYWWNEVPTMNPWAIDGLHALVQSWYHLGPKLVNESQALNLTDAYQKMPKICLFYDTTCMKQLWAYNMSKNDTLHGNQSYSWYFDNGAGANLNDAYWQEKFWRNIDDFISAVMQYGGNCSFFWNNRFVVWLYSSGWFSDVGTSVFDYCRAKCVEKYGHSIYFVGGQGWKKAGVDGVCDWGACCSQHDPQSTGIPVGGVGPGYYNLGAIAGQTPLYTARDPSKYLSEWHNIMDEGAMWIHVETWNELHEGTGICWTQEYGFKWIDLTRQMADIFHSMTGYNPYTKLNIIAMIATIGALIVMIGVAGIATRASRI